jgi:RNA polymerase sigma-70 factor (ECF subfamily)
MRLPGSQEAPVERRSLEEVFSEEESPLLRYAFGLLGRRELAEEVVQDAFLKLHEHWDAVEVPRAWLFRCVRNLAYNVLRKNKRETLDETTGERETAAERPDEELGKMEAIGMVQMLVAEMGERDRSMVRMKYFQGMKYQEIAEKLEMSVGNVGYRLHHLLKDLGDRLRKAGISQF